MRACVCVYVCSLSMNISTSAKPDSPYYNISNAFLYAQQRVNYNNRNFCITRNNFKAKQKYEN